ncbi:MAG: DUF4391 domain-containing protein [Acidobacteria bacterium]|nr:DUF4391 domain-containing protein [Acidobacteriota bacterium]
MLFEYPKKSFFGRVIPKNKIYERARISNNLRRKFVDQIERITWMYKLAPETINLRSTDDVPEIVELTIELKGTEVTSDVIRCLDNAIPFPVIHEVIAGGKTKVVAAYKRPSEGDSAKWVTDAYFESDWFESGSIRMPLPISLDLRRLYEKILGELIPEGRREGEPIRASVERINRLRSLENEVGKLESRLRKEKQFNRKVELNRELRTLKNEIGDLLD